MECVKNDIFCEKIKVFWKKLKNSQKVLKMTFFRENKGFLEEIEKSPKIENVKSENK